MNMTKSGRGTSASMAKGLLNGLCTSLLIILTCSMLLAKLLDNESISWGTAGYCIMVMLMLAAILGTTVSCALIKRKRIQVSAASGILLWSILTGITALFFGGQYDGVCVTAFLVLSSSIACGLLNIRPTKSKRRKN